MIRCIGYTPEQRHLFIEFKNGDTWRYEGIAQDEYNSLINAESQGKHFLTHIKPAKTGKKL
jgi:hypothetical protein